MGNQSSACGHKLQKPHGWGVGTGLGTMVVLVVFCQAHPFFLACPWLARSFLAAPCPPRMGLRTAAPMACSECAGHPRSWPRLSSVLACSSFLEVHTVLRRPRALPEWQVPAKSFLGGTFTPFS